MLGFPQEKTLYHLGKILGAVQSKDFKGEDPLLLSGQIKRSERKQKQQKIAHSNPSIHRNIPISRVEGAVPSQIKNFELQSQKLQWAGIKFSQQSIKLIQSSLRALAVKQKVSEIRFWGVVRGRERDYYVIQARKQPHKSINELPVGSQKNGEGVNYYSYFVSTNLYNEKWEELPSIEPTHIKVARQIKRIFTGNLQQKINSYPQFSGSQKHYLKAQICRITHALQISPKGVLKVNDENPKVIQYEEEVKIPEFAQLNTLQGWTHKNQMILNLGRCSHFVDPKIPEQEIQAKMNQLAEKDPEVQRLKGISEDKVPEELGLGLQNPWLLKLAGNSQIFTKDDTNLVYGLVVLRNIYWPGWTTIGYKNGFSNIYIGNGLKSTQTALSIYQNADLQAQANDASQFHQPNPRELPKVQPVVEGEPKPQDE